MSLRRFVLHFVVLLAVVAMVTAGFWQLHRLDERQHRNAVISDRSEQPSIGLESLIHVGQPLADARNLEYRRVSAVGMFEPEGEVLIRNRTYQSSPGYWVLTPLRLVSGALVAVNRGWVPFGVGSGGDRAAYAPPAQTTTVNGLLRATVTASGLQQPDPAAGVLVEMARPDLARLAVQLDGDLLPAYIQMTSQMPAAELDLPLLVAEPELDEGSHLTYAVQWFLFASVAAVGYPLILRRLGRPN
ncbi:MAG: SURF1 family protein [bacterium]|nr:SURF1 family protein [bacterium]